MQTNQDQGNKAISEAMIAAQSAAILEPGKSPEPEQASDDKPEVKQPVIGYEDVEKAGVNIGTEVALEITRGDQTARILVTNMASEYGDTDERMEACLKGYEIGLKTKFKDSTARTMKSQARLIFKALRVQNYRQHVGEYVVGQPPVMETRSGKEWLALFQGTFQDWLKEAKAIAEGTPNRSTGTKAVTKVTDKGMIKQMQAVKVMTPRQADEIVEAAISKIPVEVAEQVFGKIVDSVVKNSTNENPWENRLLVQIDELAQTLAEKSDQPYFKKIGAELENITEHYLAELALTRVEASKRAADEELQRQAKAQTQDVPATPEAASATGTEG